MAKHRPSCPIIVLTGNESTARKLQIVRGVQAIELGDKAELGVDEIFDHGVDMIKEMGIGEKGSKIIFFLGGDRSPRSLSKNPHKGNTMRITELK